MNQEKIGKFIFQERTNKKLTQQELADIIGVTDKAISKWENGRCLPDASLFKKICQTLDITIEELLSGERIKDDKSSKNKVIDFINYNKQKNNKKIIIVMLVSILLIVTSVLSCYFFNTYNRITIYKLYGNSENFEINDMILMKSNIKNILSTGNITILNPEIKEDYIVNISLYSENKLILGKSKIPKNTLLIENYGYDEYFDDISLENIDKWYYEIIYLNNNEYVIDKIYLTTKVELKNNKFFYRKNESIGDNQNIKNETSTSEERKKEIEKIIKIRNNLIKYGYKPNDNNISFYKALDKDVILSIEVDFEWLSYNIRDEENQAYFRIDFDKTAMPTSFRIDGTYKNTYIHGHSYQDGTLYNIEDENINAKKYLEEKIKIIINEHKRITEE